MFTVLKCESCALDTDVDTPSGKRQLCGGSQAAIEKMLLFGRDLQSMSQRLKREYGKSESNNKSLQVGIFCNSIRLIFHDILKYALYRVFFFTDNNNVLGVKERYEMYKILKHMFLEKLYYAVFIF